MIFTGTIKLLIIHILKIFRFETEILAISFFPELGKSMVVVCGGCKALSQFTKDIFLSQGKNQKQDFNLTSKDY